MQKVGMDNCVSGTDLNQWLNHPVDGLKTFMVMLLSRGMAEHDVETMFKVNPAKLLDL